MDWKVLTGNEWTYRPSKIAMDPTEEKTESTGEMTAAARGVNRRRGETPGRNLRVAIPLRIGTFAAVAHVRLLPLRPALTPRTRMPRFAGTSMESHRVAEVANGF
ncbi:unnamed protein product [Lampetra fluviatilis]